MKNSPTKTSSIEQYKTLIIAGSLVMGLLFIFCLILYIPYLLPDDGQETSWQPSPCEELLEKAMAASYQGCQLLGSNELCYGNNDVDAQLNENALSDFTNLGDTIPVNDLLTLSTAPMDLSQGVWGIAVFKLQANLPSTVPGQNVSFLVFGDTGLYNYSGDMYSIYFSTGIGSVTCSEVPDGLKVEVPEGSAIQFNANGAEIALEGDSVLAANPGETMTVTMLNGTGTVTSDGISQSLKGGEYLSVPLDEHLNANGAPSQPLPLPADLAYELCLLTDENCNPNDPLSWIDPTATTDVNIIFNQPTNTPVPVAPGENTNTSVPVVPSGSTNTPVPVAPGESTNTSVPIPTTPTSTTAPGATTPSPSNTPTATSAPTNTIASSCGKVVLGSYSSAGNTISINITNNNAGEIILLGVNLNWNSGTNGQLDQIELGSKRMWGQSENADPPANLSFSPAAPQRTLNSGESAALHFIFVNSPASALTSLQVSLDIGCSVSK